MFAVSANGSSVQTADGPQQLLSMKKPFTKLDTTNQVSFQTIHLLFNHEPPQPPNSAPFYTQTLLYRFKHGYAYIPAVWMSWKNDSPAFPADPSAGNSATTFYPNGDDNAGETAYRATINERSSGVSPLADVVYNSFGTITGMTTASLFVTADDTYVYVYVIKITLALISGVVIPLFLIGVILNIRVYVFTEPATTSTY